jgi:hypothetical protein
VIALVRHAVAFERRVLAVLDDRHAEHAGVLQRASQEERRGHRMPVVGDGHAPGLLQLGDVRQERSLGPLRHGADRVHPSQSGSRGLGQDEAGHVGVVVHRARIRHAGDAGRHGLLVLLPGLPQMHVHVDEPRTHDEARGNLHHHGVIDR